MVVDAILGFSAHGALRSPYDVIIRTINESSLPVACIDIPSGWDVTRAMFARRAFSTRICSFR